MSEGTLALAWTVDGKRVEELGGRWDNPFLELESMGCGFRCSLATFYSVILNKELTFLSLSVLLYKNRVYGSVTLGGHRS